MAKIHNPGSAEVPTSFEFGSPLVCEHADLDSRHCSEPTVTEKVSIDLEDQLQNAMGWEKDKES